MSKLLINESPLLVLPTLAKCIGLNEAIMLQQIHYWLDPRTNKNFKNGHFWVYNTYQQWQKQFPFWSERTIRRIVETLEKQNLLITDNFNNSPIDKTKWYTINYDILANLELAFDTSIGQNGRIDRSKWPDREDRLDSGDGQNGQLYNKVTKTTTKNNSDTFSHKKHDNLSTMKNISYEKEKEMIKIWNEVVKRDNHHTQAVQPRLTKLSKVLQCYFTKDINRWREFCNMIASSKFLMGEVNSFKASLDWSIKPDNLQKILEGEYGIGDRDISIALPNTVETENESEEEKHDPTWKEVRAKIKDKLGKAAFASWISKITLYKLNDREVLLLAPTKFIREWVMSHHINIITECFKSVAPSIDIVNIECRV